MDEEARRDRQFIELLNELRVALPGVQILFGFLLTVPFAAGFERVTSAQRTLLFATLLATAASTICLIAPSATHRLRFHKGDRAFIIESANRYLIAGLVWLGIAMTLAIALITDVLYDGWAVWFFPGLVGVLIAGLWFLRPLLRRKSSGP
jgi:Family of unknown function (DUF6328)